MEELKTMKKKKHTKLLSETKGKGLQGIKDNTLSQGSSNVMDSG